MSLSRTGWTTVSPLSSIVVSARMSVDGAPTRKVKRARLRDASHGAVMERESARWHDEGDVRRFVWRERSVRETNELARGSRDGGNVVGTVELHHVLAGSITHVGHCDLMTV